MKIKFIVKTGTYDVYWNKEIPRAGELLELRISGNHVYQTKEANQGNFAIISGAVKLVTWISDYEVTITIG